MILSVKMPWKCEALSEGVIFSWKIDSQLQLDEWNSDNCLFSLSFWWSVLGKIMSSPKAYTTSSSDYGYDTYMAKGTLQMYLS